MPGYGHKRFRMSSQNMGNVRLRSMGYSDSHCIHRARLCNVSHQLDFFVTRDDNNKSQYLRDQPCRRCAYLSS